MTIETQDIDGIEVLALPQRVVMANAAEIRKAIIARVESGRRRIVIDLGKTEFMDSSGLSVLISTLKAVRKVNGAVVLLNVSEGVRALIELTRLNEIFDIFVDRDAAIAQLRGL